MQRVGRKNCGSSSHGDCKGNVRPSLTVCYLCNQPIDGLTRSRDHVIPRTLCGKQPPKAKGFDYGGVLYTHPECNNRFVDEMHVRKAMRLLEVLHDSNMTLFRPAPGKLKGQVLALNGKNLPGFSQRDFCFFGIHDASNDSITSFDKPEYLR